MHVKGKPRKAETKSEQKAWQDKLGHVSNMSIEEKRREEQKEKRREEKRREESEERRERERR